MTLFHLPRTGLLPVLACLLLLAAGLFAAGPAQACPMHEASAEPAARMEAPAVPVPDASRSLRTETASAVPAAVFMNPAVPEGSCDHLHLCCVTPAALPPDELSVPPSGSSHEAPVTAVIAPPDLLLPQPTPPPLA